MSIMKVSITNSKRGLGKELSTRFDNVVDGFSEECDVFINNRHGSFNQTELLMEVFEMSEKLAFKVANLWNDNKNEGGV